MLFEALLAALSLAPCSIQEQAPPASTVFHVSPAGDDSWSGRPAAPLAEGTDGPFVTLERAQRAVRESLAAKSARGAILVSIAGGEYELGGTLSFGPEDSGTEQRPVTWRARDGAEVVISGGRRLKGWTEERGAPYRVELEEVRDGAWSFSQLWVGDQRRFRPRVPRDQHHYRGGPTGAAWFLVAEEHAPSQAAGGRGHDRLGYAAGDFSADWATSEIEVLAVHVWSASRMRVAEVDPEARVLTFTAPTRTTNHWGAFRRGNRYFVDNVRQAFGEPGDWFLDRATGVLSYAPLIGESTGHPPVVAPRLDTLLRIRGDLASDRAVQHLSFEGLDFAFTNWNLPPEGQSFPQAEVALGAAIELEGARHVSFDGCRVRHTGGYGISVGPGCRRVSVTGCALVDLGAGGVKIGGTFDPARPQLATEDVVVSDCVITGGGRLHPAAVGVWIGHASRCSVLHNTIGDFYYSGVSVGWTWGYAEPSRAHHNEIAWNLIHDIGQGVLSDMAGVYTLGVSPGTTVHHNVIRDVDAFDYGGWGLYTDEGSTGIEMTHNLVLRAKTGGFHQHYGKENLIAHNLLIEAKVQQIQRTRTEEHRSFRFVNNVVYWTNDSPLFGSNWRDDHFLVDRNLYWNPGRESLRFPGDQGLEGWRKRGHDLHSVVADPLFVDPAGDDWRFREGSPALELGVEPWDHTLAGPRRPSPFPRPLPEVPGGFR